MEDCSLIGFSTSLKDINHIDLIPSLNTNNSVDMITVKRALFTPVSSNYANHNNTKSKGATESKNLLVLDSPNADLGIDTNPRGRQQHRFLNDITNDPKNTLFPKGINSSSVSGRGDGGDSVSGRGGNNGNGGCGRGEGGGAYSLDRSSVVAVTLDRNRERSLSNDPNSSMISCNNSVLHGDKSSSNLSSAKKFTIHFKKSRNNGGGPDALNISRESSIPRPSTTNSDKENSQPSTAHSHSQDKIMIANKYEGGFTPMTKNTELNNFNIAEKMTKFKGKLQYIESNFESIVRISKKAQEKYHLISQLIKGSEFTKISFKSSKFTRRFIYYYETSEAICWRDPKNRFPKPNQIIPIRDITNICINTEKSKACKRLMNLRVDDTLYISIETKDRSLDLLAPNVDTKSLWMKTLNLLIVLCKNKQAQQEKSLANIEIENNTLEATPTGLIFAADSHEVDNISKQFSRYLLDLKNEADLIKEMSKAHNEKVRRCYLETTENIIKKEKSQYNALEKSFKELNHEYQVSMQKRTETQKEIHELKRELDNATNKNKELSYELKLFKEDKINTIKFIKDFYRKLSSYVEYLNALEFHAQNITVNAPKTRPSGTPVANNMSSSLSSSILASLNAEFNSFNGNNGSTEHASNIPKFDIQTLSIDVQNIFDSITLKTNEINKYFIQIREELKQHIENKKQNVVEHENLNKKYNELWNLHNETLKEKEKLYNQIEAANQNFKLATQDNNQLKADIKILENQINQLRNESQTKEKDLQNQMMFSKKIKVDMDNQLDQYKKEANDHEMKKLSILEDKYIKQIQRYEKKIVDAENIMKELDNLIKNHEQKLEFNTQELNEKQEEIDKLASLNAKLSLNITELEEKLKQKSTELQSLSTNIPMQKLQEALMITMNSPNKTYEQNYLGNLEKVPYNDKEKDQEKDKILDLETQLQNYQAQITILEQDKGKLHEQICRYQELEEQHKLKFIKLQNSLKPILDEDTRLKKLNKTLELNLSYWLNLVYLGNLILYYNENPHMINCITPGLHLIILKSGIKKIKDTFEGLCYKNEFFKALIKNIEDCIPNIAFDTNVIEICKLYNYKLSKEGYHLKRTPDSTRTDSCLSTSDMSSTYRENDPSLNLNITQDTNRATSTNPAITTTNMANTTANTMVNTTNTRGSTMVNTTNTTMTNTATTTANTANANMGSNNNTNPISSYPNYDGYKTVGNAINISYDNHHYQPHPNHHHYGMQSMGEHKAYYQGYSDNDTSNEDKPKWRNY